MTKSRSALEAAFVALRHRDLSATELERKLAAGGYSARERSEALATVRRTGLVDDGRYAEARAAALAGRGAGDALIRHDLERAGVDHDEIASALALLEPELARARTIVGRRGRSAKTARYLAAKGFAQESVAEAVASDVPDELG